MTIIIKYINNHEI